MSNDTSANTYRTRDVERLQDRLAAFAVAAVEHQRAEQALRESEEQFRLLIEHAGDAFFVCDTNGRFVKVNERACAYTGYGRDEFLSLHIWDIAEHVTPAVFADQIRQMTATGEPITVTGVHRRKDGTTYPVEVRASLFESGGERRIQGLVRDVTERQRAEQALRESEEMLSSVLAHAMDAIIIVDDKLRITLFNRAAETVFGRAAPTVVGRSVLPLLSPEFREMLTSHAAEADRSQDDHRHAWVPEGLTALRADGEEFAVEATVSRITAGSHSLYTIIVRDVNDRKRVEETIHKLQSETLYLREELASDRPQDEFIGSSTAFRQVLREVERVAPSDSTVLIVGETGTGKELVARALHRASRRGERVLVKVNCAALPETLIESELFGHEKGAFTGAVARKIGRFELADGGTLFLDEIGELSMDMQSKLLRVLQEGEFERVGGERTFTVDVRVIAATNRDLERALEHGTFREDLFYRLNVFPIRVPPLRERPDDIPRLVSHFVMRFCASSGKRIDAVPKAALRALVKYTWPGNVRELENVIERAVLLTDGPELQLQEWLPRGSGARPGAPTRTLDDVQREHIRAVLEFTEWRVSGARGAAKILGLKPTTLEARMKKLNITRPR